MYQLTIEGSELGGGRSYLNGVPRSCVGVVYSLKGSKKGLALKVGEEKTCLSMGQYSEVPRKYLRSTGEEC